MADLIELFGKGLHQFGLRLHQVGPGQWDLPTPCSNWTVRDVAYHVIDEQRWVPPLLAGQSLEEAAEAVAAISNLDPVSDWDEAAGKSRVAFAAAGVLDIDVSLSRGPTPASQYLTEMIMDACVHSWDLGAAIGVQPEQPDDLLQYTLDTALSWGDLSSFGDMFANPVQVAEGAALVDRLVAYTGRDPRWPAA